MLHTPIIATTPVAHLRTQNPGLPVHFFAPAVLEAKTQAFLSGFPGLVTYAVKANPAEAVLRQLHAAGLHGFDVASPDEIALCQSICPGAALHYNNPVRSRAEIRVGIAAGVASWSVDADGELAKLVSEGVPLTAEIAVRFRLPVVGAAYDFGSKFGAEPDEAVTLLAEVAAAGYRPALTFHVGTQCTDPAAWTVYMATAAAIAQRAGVAIGRLNVGGGFPSGRNGAVVDLTPFFDAIRAGLRAFPTPPTLICEPGRGLVADAFAYAVQVKSVRGGRVYLDDGIYGGLSEFPSMGLPHATVLGPTGPRTGKPAPRTVFGPTCDSLDRLPGDPALPDDLAEGDWIIWQAMGAYLTGVTTRFNGYGQWTTAMVQALG